MSYVVYLSQRYRMLLKHVGAAWMLIGLVTLSPLLGLSVFWEDRSAAPGFLLPGLVVSGAGWILRRRMRADPTGHVTLAEGTVIVVLTWLTAVVAGAVPFVHANGLTLTQAVFESMSGWTTTGLSVVDVSHASPVILLHRSIMQWCGGAGFAILMLTALTGPVGTGLAAAEGRTDQLEPHVRRSAVLVLQIYTGTTLLGILGLHLAGMGWFDAINHAFCAVSTGGFSTRTESIGYWDSPLVEAVVLVIMGIGSTNFLISYSILRGKGRVAGRTGEVRLAAGVALAAAVLIFAGVTVNAYPTLGKSLRVAVFESVTALTTTGYSTVGSGSWPSLGLIVLILLMLIGGGSGSTAGGLKQYRVYVLYKGLVGEMRRLFLPANAVVELELWHGSRRLFVSDAMFRQVPLFAFLYLGFFGLSTLVATAYGYSLQESLFEMASTLGTVGLSIGITAPDAPRGLLWVQTLGMLLGRLEFFTVFLGLGKLVQDARPFLTRTRDLKAEAVRQHAMIDVTHTQQ